MTDTSAPEFGTFDSEGNYIPRQIIDADLGGVDIEEAYTSTMVLVEDSSSRAPSSESTRTKSSSTSATRARVSSRAVS